MTTRKTIALTKRTFVDKVMSLLFNMLSRLFINKLWKILKEMGIPEHLICLFKRLGRQPWALSLPDKELCLREALAVCTPPAPEPSAKRPGS